MAIQARVTVQVAYTGNGASAMSVPGAQAIQFALPIQTMPGGDTVNSGNLNTLGTNIGSAAQTALQTYLSQISGWPTGGQ